MKMSWLAGALSAIALFMGSIMAAGATFSPRLTTPRLAPLPKDARSEAQAAMLASRPDYNVYKTFAHHIDLYNAQSQLGQFVSKASSLSPREREIVILRMGWLCQSEYEWAQHARIAKGEAGLTDAQVHSIAVGPTAKGWSDFDRAVITMVDEIRYEAMISDVTWKTLRTRYTALQIVEAMYTASHHQMVSMALNSLGVQLDVDLEDRLPKGVPLPKLAGTPTMPRLRVPRLATALHHPKLDSARRIFGSYLQRESHLPAKTRSSSSCAPPGSLAPNTSGGSTRRSRGPRASPTRKSRASRKAPRAAETTNTRPCSRGRRAP